MENYAYGQANTAAPAKLSLIDDSGRLNERLREIGLRVSKIADALHGAIPREAGMKAGGDVPSQPMLRRHLDEAGRLLNQIEAELCRVEGQL
jgi:hypothetical protein